MRALECDRPCVLLIDELDKVDEGFEAMLLARIIHEHIASSPLAARYAEHVDGGVICCMRRLRRA